MKTDTKMSQAYKNENFMSELRKYKKMFPNAKVAKPRGKDKEAYSINVQKVEGDLCLINIEGHTFWIPNSQKNKEMFLFIYEEIFKERPYESPEVQIEADDIVLDCGANVGMFTRYALEKGAGKVIAVEPDEKNVQSLKHNFHEEIEQGKVILIQKCLSNKNEAVKFETSDYFTSHRVIDSLDTEGEPSMEATTIDVLCEELNINPDFIKMDIEGHERYALSGGGAFLQRAKPKLSICSYHFEDDLKEITRIVLGANHHYLLSCNLLELTERDLILRPKVLYFN
jgi:FkbM family methyltransferase